MTEMALGAAVTRLERAIMRLERAAEGSRPRPDDTALAAAEARHGRLRAQVADAVARLDRLLGEGDAG